MDYKLIEKPAFDVVGKSRKFTSKRGQNLIKVPQFWVDIMKTPDWETIIKLNGGRLGPVTGGETLGFCFDYEGIDVFRYAIAAEKIHKKVPAGLETIHIPKATWAVFDAVGPMPEPLQNVTKRIWEEWFPSTGYEFAGTADFEVYLPGDMTSPDYRCQIWMPVKKKTK